MSLIPTSLIDQEIDRYGESITLISVNSTTYSDHGDSSETTSSSTLTAVHNDIQGDEEFNKEGIYKPGDKVFFIKSGDSASVRDKIYFSSDKYRVKDVVTHRLDESNFVSEIRCSKED